MRLVQFKRRGVAAMIAAVTLGFSGSLAGLGSASAMMPPEVVAPEPRILAEQDSALFAEPSSMAATLSRGTSSVTVSRTAGLTRQMLTVSWTGMTPSSYPALNLANGVVVMQCRGTSPDRSDCWTANNRSAVAGFYKPDETSQWWINPAGSFFGHRLAIPFRHGDGTYHALPNPNGTWNVPTLNQPGVDGMPPVDDWTPATTNQRDGETQANGTGQLQTWVNTGFEGPSLGCSESKPCSLVVIPVHAHTCRSDLTPLQTNICAGQTASLQNVTSSNWQLLANWYERYVFKLSFTPRVPKCAERNDTAPFTGSELVGEAMRRWVPSRCQVSSPVALDYTRKWEPESRTQQGSPDPLAPSGYAADGVLVSEPAAPDSATATSRKPGYAPVAVSGFAIGYIWDKGPSSPTGPGPVPDVKLNARLVAKLLTQSYPGKFHVNTYGQPVNPNAPTNPLNIIADPEFQQLNPGCTAWAGDSDGFGTQMAIPGANTDVMLALTRWIWSDPSARAFMQGKADPWGMTVNKTYRGWQMPRDGYELRDGWVIPKGSGQAEWEGFSPQQLGAASPNSWAEGTDSLMTAWPLSQSPVVVPGRPDLPPQPKRSSEGQAYPNRQVIALSTTSELEKLGMRSALLQNSAGDYVGPNLESMTYALDGATVDQSTGVWRINHAAMDKRGYPGTMITYAAVPTSTLKGTAPKRYADMIRWMSTDAQVYGADAGQLPDGYLALTEPMKAQAAKVADAVEKQTGTPPIPPKNHDPLPHPKDPTPKDPHTPNPDQPHTPGQVQPKPGTTTTAPNNGKTGPTTPVATPSGSGTQRPVQAIGSPKPVSAITKGESLGWLTWGIPALLLAGLLAGVASPGIRLIAQPGHPVRRVLGAGGNYLASLIRRGRRRNS